MAAHDLNAAAQWSPGRGNAGRRAVWGRTAAAELTPREANVEIPTPKVPIGLGGVAVEPVDQRRARISPAIRSRTYCAASWSMDKHRAAVDAKGDEQDRRCVFLGAAKTQPRQVTRLRSSPVGRGTASHLDKGAIEGPVCRVYSFGL